MKKNLFSFLTLFLLSAFFFSAVSIAFAQDGGDDSDVFTLEEVTVTAAKTGEQDLQKVPIAMDVITGQDFAEGAKANVDDILEGLAGVFINTSSDGMRVSIRGVTDTDPVFGGKKSSTPTVAMNVDGAYNSMNTAGQNLFDVERIEVLMGPQSTLYASNSPGGIVNIITASPKTDRYSANVSAEYGSYERNVLQAALNVPIVQDKFAARLSLNRTRENNFMEPYTDNLSTKNDAARLKVLWKASDDLEITLTGNYAKNGNQGEMSQQAAGFDKASGSSDWTSAENASGSNSPIDQKTTGGNLNISWSAPFGNLSIEPSYSKSDSSGDLEGLVFLGPPGPGTPTVPDTWYSERIMEQKSTEARISSPEDFGLLQYVLGLYYYESAFETETTYETFTDQNRWETADTEQKAVYGNLTYPLPFNEKLSVTVGYRHSWDYAHQTGNSPGGDDETEMDVSNPDYKLGFQYDMDDQTMFYGNYTSSFRLDGMAMFNNTGIRPPEEMYSYTVGAKTRMLDNRVQLNTSVYYYEYKNKFVQDTMTRTFATRDDLENLYIPAGQTYYDGDTMVTSDGALSYWDSLPENEWRFNPELGSYEVFDKGFLGWGDSRTFGADVSVSWIPTNKDLVNFTLSYLNVEWTSLSFIYKYTEFFNSTNYDGATAPNAPELSMAASYEHKFDIGHYGVLKPHVDVQYKSGFDLVFDQQTGPAGYGHQEDYFIYNASLAFNSAGQKWNVNAIVKNIGNYAVKRSYMADQQVLMLGDPRTYVITATVRF